MTNNKKYFRTYIVEFSTSTGIKYYAGQRTSKYPDPKDDPYTGSGNVIRHAKKKYGPECIKSIQWFDHADKAEMNTAEVQLITECKAKHGSKCVNIAGGGYTNPLEYATEEQKAEVAAKKSVAMKESCARPEVRERKSAASKEANARPEVKARRSAAQNRPEVKAKRSAAMKEAWADPEVRERKSAAQNRPEVRERKSAGVKEAKRTSPVWHGELYATLWQTWLATGMPKYKKFRNYCRRAGITDLPVQNLVNHFNERYALEQPVPDVPDNVVPIHQPNLMWLYDQAA